MPNQYPGARYWTKDEESLLVRLYGLGVPHKEIADLLDRSRLSVDKKLQYMFAAGLQKRGMICSMPENCHPMVKFIIAEMNRQRANYDDIHKKSGVASRTICGWRTQNQPHLDNIEAVINSLGYEIGIYREDGKRVL